MAFRSILRVIWRICKYLLVLMVLLAIAIVAFLYLAPTFGANPSGESLERVKASPNYRDDQFVNLQPMQLSTRDPSEPMDVATYFFPPENKNPNAPLPSVEFDSNKLVNETFAWLGHSSIIFKTDSMVVLADPVFNRASPVPLVGNPFPMQSSPMVTALPDIDVVVISHDHYDHLDHRAIADLQATTGHFLVPLGIGAHLRRWGVPEGKITELDWYQSNTINNTKFTLTPARHFSGRGLTNRYKTLWGSWVINSPQLNVFFSGDTGYFDELAKIGNDYGPFDIAFLENGAYSLDWTQVHMMPEESVQAAIDLQSNVYFPIHWGKFDLAQHIWKDPIIRATKKAESLDVTITTPVVGEVFSLDKLPQQQWWTNAD